MLAPAKRATNVFIAKMRAPFAAQQRMKQTMITEPPFCAEHVGSLLRPAEIKDARAKLEQGAITAADLKAIEDRSIRRAVAKQESLGLRVVTDGEYRRSFWSRDFFRHLDNVETFSTPNVKRFQGSQPKTLAHRPTARLGAFSGHPMIDHFRYLKSVAASGSVPKMTIPAPSAFLAHRGKTIIDGSVYNSFEEFYADLAQTYRKVVRAFGDAGCRYLQLDEVYMIVLVDPKQRQFFVEHGNDADKLPDLYSQATNVALSDKPADMVIGMHLCRGNFRSTFQGAGSYDAIADILFNKTNIDVYFMEYDSDRAGGFEPLRLVPKGKKVVLGLVTSKTGTLESKDEIKRRVDAAAKFIDIDQLRLSPQCGFASTEEGNLLTEDEQWAKLSFVVEVAEEIWGRA
jgi:5-methyltetrahydropteroyltriglutamate--homocysteine methyltransferase